jgi:predicted ATP-binding protein involved in virulence
MSETKEQQPAYISRVHLKGYKSIRDLEIDFKAGLNIIIGPNGSGKTNFLEFLDASMSTNKLNPIRYEFSSQVEAIDIHGDKVKLLMEGNSKATPSKKVHQFVIHELIKIENDVAISDREIIFTNGQEIPEFKVNTPFTSESPFINAAKYLRFANPLNLSLNQGMKLEVVDSVYLEPSEDGETIVDEVEYSYLVFLEPLNLGGVETLIQRSFDSFRMEGFIPLKKRFNMNQNSFKETLSRFTIIKDIDFDLEIARAYDSSKLDNLFFKFFVNEKWLYWNQLSDGTKRLFYILVNVFFADSTENIAVFIEEPELGIHPDQLYLLMDFLKEQSKEKQIIITTHSPEVLNILNKEELDRIIVTRYDAEKGTQMHHLSPKKIRKGVSYMSKEGLTLKDFWVHSNLEEYDEEEYEIR